MSRAEILVKIKDAESKAKEYIAKAEDESKAIVANARQSLREVIALSMSAR